MMEDNDRGITPQLINEILETVCILLDINKPEIHDTAEYRQLQKEYEYTIQILTIYIQTMCNKLLILTNRKIFTPNLKYIIIDLIVDKYNVKKLSSEDKSSIQNMSEAGRSVTFGVSSIIAHNINAIVDSQLQQNSNLINKFKLLYKI